MSLPSTIRPAVSPALITRATRLFNGTVDDCLLELTQNARRAGANRVNIDLAETGDLSLLVVRDDGCGIDDPANLVRLGQSGWDADIAAREDPAGMGVFSLAGRRVTVRSWSASAGTGWQVTIPEDGWEGLYQLAVEKTDMSCGTEIRVNLSRDWAERLEQAARKAARYFRLPVLFKGQELERHDFLDGACHVEEHDGYRIGVFLVKDREPIFHPRVNFHGVTVPLKLDNIVEVDGPRLWLAKVDIFDAPSLQLVLPARKEMVENAALTALRIAMEIAMYRAIAKQESHRLPFKAWQRAHELGVDLPEAAAWLDAWTPINADGKAIGSDERAQSVDMVIVDYIDADLAQAAAPVLQNRELIGGPVAHADQHLEGYQWYDRLRHIESVDVTFEHEGSSWIYGNSAKEALPCDMVSGRVPALHLELAIATSANSAAQSDLHVFEIDALAAGNDGYSADDAIILVAEAATLSPDELAVFMEASLFNASEDAGSDSWQTQNDDFCRQVRFIANELLLGSKEAVLAGLREAIAEHVTWLIPQGQVLHVTATTGDQSLRLTPPA